MIYSVRGWDFINMKSLWFSWDLAGLFWTINLAAVVIVSLWVTSTLYYSAERWILPVADDLLVKQNDYCVFHCKYRTPFIGSGGLIGIGSCLSNVSLTLWILMTDFMAIPSAMITSGVPLIVGEQKDFNSLSYRKEFKYCVRWIHSHVLWLLSLQVLMYWNSGQDVIGNWCVEYVKVVLRGFYCLTAFRSEFLTALTLFAFV